MATDSDFLDIDFDEDIVISDQIFITDPSKENEKLVFEESEFGEDSEEEEEEEVDDVVLTTFPNVVFVDEKGVVTVVVEEKQVGKIIDKTRVAPTLAKYKCERCGKLYKRHVFMKKHSLICNGGMYNLDACS